MGLMIKISLRIFQVHVKNWVGGSKQ